MREIRKFIVPLFFLSVLVLPSNLFAKKIYMKFSFGLVAGGDIEDALISHPEYNDFVSVSSEIHSKPGTDIRLEFIYQLNPHLGFSIGYGYLHKTLTGKTFEYTPPDLPPSLVFTVYPQFCAEANPFYLSAIFSFSLASSIRVNLTGGVAYYLMTYENITEWHTIFQSEVYYRSTYNFKQKSNQIGYHFGAGFDVRLSNNLLLTIDALYRIVDLQELESLDLSDEFYITWEYMQGFMQEPITEPFDYQLSEANLNGLSVSVGLKFKF